MADTALPAVRRERLRIAIQKKGRLGEPARALLSACGLAWPSKASSTYGPSRASKASRRAMSCWIST